MHRVEGMAAEAKFRGVGLADHNRTGGAKPRDRRVIPRGRGRAEQRRALRGGQPLCIRQILDRHGNAVQPALARARVGGLSLGQQSVAITEGDDGIHLAVHCHDPVQCRLHQLDRGYLSRGQRLRQF